MWAIINYRRRCNSHTTKKFNLIGEDGISTVSFSCATTSILMSDLAGSQKFISEIGNVSILFLKKFIINYSTLILVTV